MYNKNKKIKPYFLKRYVQQEKQMIPYYLKRYVQQEKKDDSILS